MPRGKDKRKRKYTKCKKGCNCSRHVWLTEKINVRNMSDVEAAYVGALVDGEGSFCLGAGGAKHCELSITNSEIELFSALLRAIGTGHIYLQMHRKENTKYTHNVICFCYRIFKRNDVVAVAERIKDYSVKAQKFLKIWKLVIERG